MAGLRVGDGSTRPIAFTRGLLAGGGTAWTQAAGVYGSEGGFIVYLGGNIAPFTRNFGASASTGTLTNSNGNRTNNLLDTIRPAGNPANSAFFIEETFTGGNGSPTQPSGG